MTEENGQGVDDQGNWEGWYDGASRTPSPSNDSPQNGPGWEEGGIVEDMGEERAKKEIKAIESDVNFAGDGKMDYWSRQNMLKRRDSLYRHAYPEKVDKPYSGMEETLQKQGITEETLEADHERFAERDYEEEKAKTMDSLILHFGGEKEGKKAITEAKGLLKRFAKEEDMIFLDESGLGNDPELIQKLAEIARIFEKGGKKNEK